MTHPRPQSRLGALATSLCEVAGHSDGVRAGVGGLDGQPTLTFKVHSRAIPQGSLRSFRHRQSGRIVTTHSRPEMRDWREMVAGAAAQAMQGRPLIDGPVALSLLFVFARPRGHYGRGSRSSVLRPSAPAHMAVRPDTDRLCRSVLDALTGSVLRDDSLVASLTACKVYGSPERCEIAVFALPSRAVAAPPEPTPARVQLVIDDVEGRS